MAPTWDTCVAIIKNAKTDVATLDCFPVIFQRFVIAAFWFAGITAVIMIAFAGIRIILAQGDAKKLEGARHTLTYAIIGLVVIFTAALIVNIVAFVTDVTCINTAWYNNCK
ncbi:MAG: hypothetical protein HYV39_02090 [Candidatus Levybacteria bacterium]|nr:hypothetical protein [Candidatus Levybacteria bacterium]